MSARARSAPKKSVNAGNDEPAAVVPEPERPGSLLGTALGVATAGALALAGGSLSPVVLGAPPGYRSWPLLVVLAVLPVLIAAGFLRRRPTLAGGVLVGTAALAPGRVLLDLQFVADPTVAARPELYLPTSAQPFGTGAGLWLLLAGHLGGFVAGVLAWRALTARGETQEGAGNGEGRNWLFVVLLLATVTAVGLLMSPFGSDNPYLAGHGAFDGPVLQLAGYVVLAAMLPLAAALAMSAAGGDLARGCLAGLAVGAGALALTHLVSALSVPELRVAAGPVVALAGAVALGASGALVARRSPVALEVTDDADRAAEATLPAVRKLRAVTGALGLVNAALAATGCFTAQVVASSGATVRSAWAPSLLTAGLLAGVLSLALFAPPVARAVRPALSVVLAAVVLTGTAVVDTAVSSTTVPGGLTPAGGGPAPGAGAVWTVLALLAALLTAVASVVTGMVEREHAEDVEDAEQDRAAPALITPAVAGVVLAVVAFGTTTVAAPDYLQPGLWSGFGIPSWGLLAALLTVTGAALLAPRSRPAAAAALLAGAAGVLAVRAADVVLVVDRIPGAGAGKGGWFAAASALAFLVAAALAVRGRRASDGPPADR